MREKSLADRFLREFGFLQPEEGQEMTTQRHERPETGMEALARRVGESVDRTARKVMEAAVERTELAIKVTAVSSRLEAFNGVLEVVERQISEAQGRMASTKSDARKALLKYQLDFLERSRDEILGKALEGHDDDAPRLKVSGGRQREDDEPGGAA